MQQSPARLIVRASRGRSLHFPSTLLLPLSFDLLSFTLFLPLFFRSSSTLLPSLSLLFHYYSIFIKTDRPHLSPHSHALAHFQIGHKSSHDHILNASASTKLYSTALTLSSEETAAAMRPAEQYIPRSFDDPQVIYPSAACVFVAK